MTYFKIKSHFEVMRNKTAAAAESLKSFPTLCDPIDRSQPGSPIPGILQARTLEWRNKTTTYQFFWGTKLMKLHNFEGDMSSKVPSCAQSCAQYNLCSIPRKLCRHCNLHLRVVSSGVKKWVYLFHYPVILWLMCRYPTWMQFPRYFPTYI